MEHERKWYSPGRMALTLGLILALLLVIFVEIILFISGPAIRYDDKVASQEAVITAQYEDIQNLHRHVFSYIIYSGQDASAYYWFNENGDLLTWRALSDIKMEEAQAKAVQEYALEDTTIAIGYGYKNPVYIIENDEAELYLDIDTMDQVFYRMKG